MTILIKDTHNAFEAHYELNIILYNFLIFQKETDLYTKSTAKVAELVQGLFILIVFHQTMSPSTNPMNLAGKVIDFSRFFISPFYKITDIFKFVFKYFIISIPIVGIAHGIVKIAHTTENALTRQNREFNIKSSELDPDSLLTIEILFKTISLILIYQMRRRIDPILAHRLILSTTLPFIISKGIDRETKKNLFPYIILTICGQWLMFKNLYVLFIPLFR
ncbi:MAG: hypothetical protein ACOVOR_05030 [Rhabdochlamydiaceae bacterium]